MAVGGRLNGADRFAIDFLRLDTMVRPPVTFRGDGTRNTDYLAYGVPLAVADGAVAMKLPQPSVVASRARRTSDP